MEKFVYLISSVHCLDGWIFFTYILVREIIINKVYKYKSFVGIVAPKINEHQFPLRLDRNVEWLKGNILQLTNAEDGFLIHEMPAKHSSQ